MMRTSGAIRVLEVESVPALRPRLIWKPCTSRRPFRNMKKAEEGGMILILSVRPRDGSAMKHHV
jgi:hypothetical protein